jgi:hypothetical protein
MLQLHQGRVWMNDKTALDELNYSSPFNPEEWSGYGDSGVLAVGFGDGDPSGFTCIEPPLKGDLFVHKQLKSYRIVGQFPEDYQPILITNSIGAVSHKSAVSVDMQDNLFFSYILF